MTVPPDLQSTHPGRSRRRWIALALMVMLVVATRAALPSVLHLVIEAQAAIRLAGKLSVGDVDLALLRGELVLEDVALWEEHAGPGDAPLVAWRSLRVNVRWLALLRKQLQLQRVDLLGLSVHVDRRANGEFALPTLRVADADEKQPTEPEDAPSEPWGIAIEQLTFEDGVLQLEDRVPDPPEARRLLLPTLRLERFRLQPDADAEPGRGSLRIELGDGFVELRARLRTVESGIELALDVEVAELPLDRVHVHLPQLGWTASRGRVSALVAAEISPTRPLLARGSVRLDDLVIEVPDEDGAALAWRSLVVEASQIDLAARRASIERVALDGGSILVRPQAPVPLPVLSRSLESSPAEPVEKVAQAAPGDGPTWSWNVGRLAVTDTRAILFLEPRPLEVELHSLDVKGLASAPGTEATIRTEIGVADGTLAANGSLVMNPLGGVLAIRATDLDLGRLAAASAALPLPLAARLDAEIEIVGRQEPLVARGRVALRDVEMKLEDGEEFLLASKRLAFDVTHLRVPGILPIGNEGGLREVDIHIATAQLDEPRVVTTRTPEGLILPVPATDGDDAPATAANASRARLALVADNVLIRDGEVHFTDTTVTPAYRGRLAQLAFEARGVRVPQNRLDQLTLSTLVAGTAPFELTGTRSGGTLNLTGSLRGVPLSQFSPYATPYGYRIAQGVLSYEADATIRGNAYDSVNRLRLQRLAVTGAGGSGLFNETFGVPLNLALALLSDTNGVISLDFPIARNESGTSIAAVSVLREALTRAIVGALASPLKLLGAVQLREGKIEAFEPTSIAFVHGTTEIAPASVAQVEQLSSALAQLPSLRIQIVGHAGASDARVLAEQAVLAELDDEPAVVGGARNLLSGGTRSLVHDALRARAEGKLGALEGEAADVLDAWVAEHPIDDARLHALATQRVALLQRALVQGGARLDQIVVGEPTVRRTRGLAEVEVALTDEQMAPDNPD